jgi:ADP-heptose:LPS heptosyltransferase
MAGKTPLNELIKVMAKSKLVLSVDSGSAHLANAIGVPVIDIHGADDESNTVPFNHDFITNIRHGKLPCEPCVKNICPLYDSPQCLEQLDEQLILNAVIKQLSTYK